MITNAYRLSAEGESLGDRYTGNEQRKSDVLNIKKYSRRKVHYSYLAIISCFSAFKTETNFKASSVCKTLI